MFIELSNPLYNNLYFYIRFNQIIQSYYGKIHFSFLFFQNLLQFLQIQRFHQIFCNPCLFCLRHILRKRIGRHGNDRDCCGIWSVKAADFFSRFISLSSTIRTFFSCSLNDCPFLLPARTLFPQNPYQLQMSASI